jgi:hypothetical protein
MGMRPLAHAEVASGLRETAVRPAAGGRDEGERPGHRAGQRRCTRAALRRGHGARRARRGHGNPAGVSAEHGLALATVAAAPVRVADAVLGRLAVTVAGEDILTPFLPPADANMIRFGVFQNGGRSGRIPPPGTNTASARPVRLRPRGIRRPEIRPAGRLARRPGSACRRRPAGRRACGWSPACSDRPGTPGPPCRPTCRPRS